MRLSPGDRLQVESNPHSNGLVPEGAAFGYARGSWIRVTLVPAGG